MSISLHNWYIIASFTIGILATFNLLGKYLGKYKYSPLRNLESVRKSPERYKFYFLTLGIFMPLTEILLELYHVREKSELVSSFIFSAICISFYLLASKSDVVKNKLHHAFAIFFSCYGLAVLFQIHQYPDSLINATELSLVMAFSYYAFSRFRDFIAFNISVLFSLFILHFLHRIDVTQLILLINLVLISMVMNYIKDIIDRNVANNLYISNTLINSGSILAILVD